MSFNCKWKVERKNKIRFKSSTKSRVPTLKLIIRHITRYLQPEGRWQQTIFQLLQNTDKNQESRSTKNRVNVVVSERSCEYGRFLFEPKMIIILMWAAYELLKYNPPTYEITGKKRTSGFQASSHPGMYLTVYQRHSLRYWTRSAYLSYKHPAYVMHVESTLSGLLSFLLYRRTYLHLSFNKCIHWNYCKAHWTVEYMHSSVYTLPNFLFCMK